ncbi:MULTISPECIES: hypothetical protein [Lactobacillus]|nr:hypothetical protein [Lactobacillus amylovorus]
MAIIITGKTYDTVPKILGEINVKEENRQNAAIDRKIRARAKLSK